MKSKTFTEQQVMQILANNGIDKDYFEEIGGKEVEGGSEEWMDVISDITGKNAYDESNFTDIDNYSIQNFIDMIENMGIELV